MKYLKTHSSRAVNIQKTEQKIQNPFLRFIGISMQKMFLEYERFETIQRIYFAKHLTK